MAGVRPQTWRKPSPDRGGGGDAVRNERLEPTARDVSVAAEELEQRVDGQERRRWQPAHHQAVATPRPIGRICAQADANRIQRDVSNDLEEIRVGRYRRRAIARAEDVTVIALDRVERSAV